jgi:hypothetical protein
VRRRSGAFLVVAPHAAVRSHDAPNQRANDLHTGAVAEALAERIDGSVIVNYQIDRNLLDLNRTSTVRHRAGWFADALQDVLHATLARHASACVVFVHGWHVMQPRCDIGIGARLGSVAQAAGRARTLTASPAWLAEHVEPFRGACASLGVRATYGERWPGAHPNNLLQIFRRTPRGGEEGALATLAGHAAADRVEAVQLELGAPLRWPGRLRDAFVGALAHALTDGAAASDGGPSATMSTDRVDGDRPGAARPGLMSPRARSEQTPAAPADAARAEPHPARRHVALQLYDGREGGFGLVAGIAHLPDGDTGARLLLFLGGRRMAVFIGHERGHGDLAVAGLRVDPVDGGFELRFRGWALVAEDGARYFADERAQREAELTEVEAALSYRRLGTDGYGRATGRIELGRAALDVAAFGFTAPLLVPPRGSARGQTRALACFGPALAVVAETAADSSCIDGEGRAALGAARRVEDETAPGAGFALVLPDGRRLDGRPESAIRLWRPVGEGASVRVTFGLARFRWNGSEEGGGFYEHVESDLARA